MLTGASLPSTSASRCRCPVANCVDGMSCVAFGVVSDGVVMPSDESCYDEVVEASGSDTCEFNESPEKPCQKRGMYNGTCHRSSVVIVGCHRHDDDIVDTTSSSSSRRRVVVTTYVTRVVVMTTSCRRHDVRDNDTTSCRRHDDVVSSSSSLLAALVGFGTQMFGLIILLISVKLAFAKLQRELMSRMSN